MATYFHKLAPDVRLVVGNKESHHFISILHLNTLNCAFECIVHVSGDVIS